MKEMVEAKVTHHFTASAERVFDAWLDPSMVRNWMSLPSPLLGAMDVRRIEIDARVGGRFTFSDMREDGEAVHWGFYREIDRPRRLVFSWFTSKEEEEENRSVVTLTIEPADHGCVATIVHSMDAKWVSYVKQTENGWHSLLSQIDSLFTGQHA
jgi:uncharacterized protein YndB with AHSA1/START domain